MPEFTKLPLVYYLDVSRNNLSSRVGEQAWEMPSLQMLNLARNWFSGNLPEHFGSSKVENLDLSENKLSGVIPAGFGDLHELMQLKLNGNDLSGEIPEELSRCKKLVILDLSDNRLMGTIPSRLSEMPVLSQLDLSENELTGEIPSDLGQVESLTKVNISHNHLCGKLPSTSAFIAMNASAFAGNDLCGREESTGLPPCRGTRKSVWWLLFISLLVVAVMVCLLAYVFFFVRQQNGPVDRRIETEDGVWEVHFFDSEASKSLALDDVLLSAVKANVISRGENGTSYKGRSSAKAMDFFLKELDGLRLNKPNLGVEAVELGKLRHPNIVKLLAIFISQKKVYLVYEHVNGNVLREILQGLNWHVRRKIALGVARALKYLHCNNRPSILVSNISPEKIIIDQDNKVRLRLSLPGLIRTSTKCFNSPPYVAPG